MSTSFLTENFLLHSKAAIALYHEHAGKMPVYDYHSHLPAARIAGDLRFNNLTQAWLYGDHYKWRAMRANGVGEDYITGNASDFEKFLKWAETVPFTLRNPLYHWTHMELKNPFGIKDRLLHPGTAKEIYDSCSEMLRSPEFSVRNLLRKMNVKLVCTTEGPLDSLEHHKKIQADGFDIKVYPAFRADQGLAVEDPLSFNQWIENLEEVSRTEVTGFSSYLEAIQKRHHAFHESGCRLSDYGLETAYAEEYTAKEIERIFGKIRLGKKVNESERLKFKSAVLLECARMDCESGWVLQLHLGALRNTNTRMWKILGPDAGFDSIGDFEIAKPLARFLDRLELQNRLPKTILYNLNPRDNELIAALMGSFQDGSAPGKMQYGPGWWFLDQKEGIERQMSALSNMGLLSRFAGMVTDSRSFLSYSRHEYFRRILCNLLGEDVEKGRIPRDMDQLGRLVEDICFNNARNYFPLELEP